MNGREAAAHIARQITTVLQNLPPEDYAAPLPVLNGGSLGKHFRHIIDFYLCLLRDVENSAVDYARRERNALLETSPNIAAQKMAEIARQVQKLEEQDALQVRAEFSSREGESRPLYPTSVGRELMYAYDHALHHLAIIRIGLEQRRPDLPVAHELGMAPSTIKYQRNRE